GILLELRDVRKAVEHLLTDHDTGANAENGRGTSTDEGNESDGGGGKGGSHDEGAPRKGRGSGPGSAESSGEQSRCNRGRWEENACSSLGVCQRPGLPGSARSAAPQAPIPVLLCAPRSSACSRLPVGLPNSPPPFFSPYIPGSVEAPTAQKIRGRRREVGSRGGQRSG